MQEADRTGMKIPAKPPEVVAAEAVLVPAVVDRSDVPGEYQQERRERAQLVDPHPLLELHPLLDLARVVPTPPAVQIDHHHPGVEVAGLPAREGQGERRVRPECGGEVGSEVGVAVLRRGEHGRLAELRGRQLGNVVDEDEV
ncbi:hypothetical protein PanWU01x14_328190 [Parasponia andersonii]|uniref:Uncharacterized protein n=1 Tax=Parasponia andersonii TaxID=3476 RepID=A0A2P5AIS9_PARAD|nr:hypothetical protein PanWU01x14_328190 [Parasponia andersonii]